MNKPEYGRRYRENNREKEKARARLYRSIAGCEKDRDPKKEKCRATIRNRVASGKIPKPLLCEACSKPAVLHAHHEDYSKPFDVRWLCSVCHGAVHRAALASGEKRDA